MINLIVAMDPNRLIGKENLLPWHYREDLKYFRETTSGHDILMGRLTFESILSYSGKPLPNRFHYVATRKENYDMEQVAAVGDLQSFLRNYPVERELFVIGGTTLYEQTLPLADRLYITHIEKEYAGDAYFPAVDWSLWECVSRRSEGELTFAVYERRESPCG